MVTREWPTQSLDLGDGGGAELLGPADGCVGVEVQVELGPGGAGQLAEGPGLADAEGILVAGGLEVGGGGADPVVQVGEGHRVPDDVELAGAGVLGRVRVVQGHVPGLPGLFLAGGVLLGHVRRDGLGDGAVEEGDPDGGQPGGEDPVDVGGGLHRQGVGLLGDPAGPPDRDVQRLGAAPGVREPVHQVEGVGDQRHRGGGGHAEGEAEGFGCERGHRGGAVTAERLVGVQVAVAAPDGGAGVGGGGVQDAPLVGELELAEVGFAAAFVRCRGGRRAARRVRGRRPRTGRWRCCSWV